MCDYLSRCGGDMEMLTGFRNKHAFSGGGIFIDFFMVFCVFCVVGGVANMCFPFLGPMFGFACFAD